MWCAPVTFLAIQQKHKIESYWERIGSTVKHFSTVSVLCPCVHFNISKGQLPFQRYSTEQQPSKQQRVISISCASLFMTCSRVWFIIVKVKHPVYCSNAFWFFFSFSLNYNIEYTFILLTKFWEWMLHWFCKHNVMCLISTKVSMLLVFCNLTCSKSHPRKLIIIKLSLSI